jgi:hypothetical protein
MNIYMYINVFIPPIAAWLVLTKMSICKCVKHRWHIDIGINILLVNKMTHVYVYISRYRYACIYIYINMYVDIDID